MGAAVVAGIATGGAAESPAPLPWFSAGHAGRIRALACASDGTIASASDDATVKLWSSTGALLRTLNVHPTPATAVALSPDGWRVALGTYGGSVHRWNRATDQSWASESVARQGVTALSAGRLGALAFSPAGDRFAAGSVDGTNFVVRTADGVVVARLNGASDGHPAPIHAVAFSAANWLASGAEDGTVRVWDDTLAERWTARRTSGRAITAIAFSPDGARLTAAGLDGDLEWFDVPTAKSQAIASAHPDSVTALALSADGRWAATGGPDGTIRLWSAPDAAPGATLTSPSAVTCLVFASDGDTLYAGFADHRVRWWSVADPARSGVFGDRADPAHRVAFSPDGTRLALTRGDGAIDVYRVPDGPLLRSIQAQPDWISSLTFSPDSEQLAAAGGPVAGGVLVWRLSDGGVVQRLDPFPGGATCVAYLPDGVRLAVGGDATDQGIQLRRVADGALLADLPGHATGVSALAFTPSGDRLLSVGRRLDATVKVWRVADGELLQTLAGHTGSIDALAIDEHGQLVATGSSGDGTLRLWKLAEGTGVPIATGLLRVMSFAFTPDGTALAIAALNGVDLREAATGALRARLVEGLPPVNSVAFTPNGSLLVVGRDDGTAGVHPSPTTSLQPAPLRLERISLDPSGAVRLGAQGTPAARYRVEVSGDLQSWSFVTNVTGAVVTGAVETEDQAPAGATGRFYRAFTPR